MGIPAEKVDPLLLQIAGFLKLLTRLGRTENGPKTSLHTEAEELLEKIGKRIEEDGRKG